LFRGSELDLSLYRSVCVIIKKRTINHTWTTEEKFGMIPFERIHHVSIAVRNLERARAFYGGVLKLPEMERPPFQSKGIWYAIGDQQLHLIEHPKGETLRSGGIDSTDGHFAPYDS
jgi:catechol-2,3-dioxygenase